MTIEEKLAAAEAKASQLEAEAKAFADSIASKDAKIAELETASNLAAEKSGIAAAKITELGDKLTASEAEVVKLKAESKSADEKAAAIVAKSGVPPVASSPAGSGAAANEFSSMTGKELAAHYAKLSGSEKEKFYATHIAPRIS